MKTSKDGHNTAAYKAQALAIVDNAERTFAMVETKRDDHNTATKQEHQPL